MSLAVAQNYDKLVTITVFEKGTLYKYIVVSEMPILISEPMN